jgi:ribose 5-phosphate isomerase B
LTYCIATDHAGFEIKTFIKDFLIQRGVSIVDLGPESNARVDYPDFARKVCAHVANTPQSHGILVCGTGIGMSIAANKHTGIRAALCHDAYTASMARAHNDANVLCLGQRISGHGILESILDAWHKTPFEGGRHAERVAKIERSFSGDSYSCGTSTHPNI